MNNGSTKLYNVLMGNPNYNNAIGRTAGTMAVNNDSRNFFQKRWDSIKNAFGSTGAALASAIKDSSQNTETDLMLRGNQGRMQDIVKKYGYNSLDDYYNALDDAEVNDKAKYNELLNTVQAELKNQSAANMEAMKRNQADYKDWVDNNYVSNQLKQDRGKFAGSAINTLSTAVDLTGLSATPIANSIQGGIEGVADELEQNGLENFDWNRAGQNAAIGATTGLVTGALNKGISNRLAKNGGNLFKGNNALTKGLNSLGSKTALGRGVSTIATGAGRGAISGAVGGATGAGLSAAMNNGDVIQSALQGAKQGAVSGATTGGIMAGANMAISKTPGVGKFYNDLQNAKANWDKSGSNFDERLTNTLNSGESGIGNWINGKSSKLLNSVGNIGDTIRDYTDQGMGPRKAEAKAYEDLIKEYYDDDMGGIEGALRDAEAAAYPGDSNFRKAQRLVEGGSLGVSIDDAFNGLKSVYGDDFNLDIYLNKDGSYKYKNGEPYVWTVYKNKLAMNLANKLDAMDAGNYAAYNKAYPDNEITNRLNEIRNSIENENVSYGELAELQDYKPQILALGDTELAQWAGIPEEEFQAYQAQNPTTAKGWAKKALNRVVEDVNNKGVGMSIKNVADDMPKDVRNLKIVDNNNIDTTSDVEIPKDVMQRLDYLRNEIDNERISYGELAELQDYKPQILKLGDTQLAEWAGIPEEEFMAYQDNAAPVAKTTRTRTPNAQVDGWDRVAQEAGYNSYNDAIRAYMEANPDTPLNPRGAAGQILTWLDENPNTPTTAGEWAKRAGQRIVEDANERGVGLGIRDVSQETPETEIYRRLTGQNATTEEALPEVFEPEARNQIEKRNKFQSVGEQLINTSKQQKYRALYDSLDGKTATRAIETNAPETLADMGIKPENYLEAAKTSNYVNKVMTDLADQSGVVVDVPDMTERLANAKGDVILTPNAQKEFNDTIKQIVADGSTPDEYSTGYLLQKSRELGDKAAHVRGNADDVKTLSAAYSNAKWALRDLVNGAMDDANITGPTTNQKIAEGLKKMGANQKVIDYYTAPVDGDAPKAGDYVHRTALFEQARDMGTQVKAEQLTRSASKQPTNWATRLWRASGLDQPVELLLNNTIAPLASTVTKYSGKAIKGIGDAAANVATPINNSNSATINTNYNPATNIYNAIARTEGLTNGEQARTANYLVDAVQEAEVVPNTSANSLEALVSPTTTSTTSVYDSVYGSPLATTTTSQESPKTGYFQTTGDYWTDLLASAMSSAIDDNNATAFASLYAMYQDALSNLQKQNSTSSEQKLTATQQRANAAMNSLERLAGMTPDLGYNLSNIPVVGDIATFGGNDYESEAKSLAQQIGYMVSGSNIKDNEAEAIGKAYVPQPFDNEQTRQNKLRRAYEIISQYQNGYAS